MQPVELRAAGRRRRRCGSPAPSSPAGFSTFDQQIDHERRGDEVEHDGGDDDVAAALGLQIGRDQRPSAPTSAAASDGQRKGQPPGQHAVEGQADERHAEAGDIGLALAADVEQAGMEGDRHREPGEDEVGGVEQREADALAVAEGAVDQDDGGARAGSRRPAGRRSPATRKATDRLMSGISP